MGLAGLFAKALITSLSSGLRAPHGPIWQPGCPPAYSARPTLQGALRGSLIASSPGGACPLLSAREPQPRVPTAHETFSLKCLVRNILPVPPPTPTPTPSRPGRPHVEPEGLVWEAVYTWECSQGPYRSNIPASLFRKSLRALLVWSTFFLCFSNFS